MSNNNDDDDNMRNKSIIRIIKSRRMRWAGHVARMGEKRNSYVLLVRKPEGKRPLGRPMYRWVDNIRMDILGLVNTFDKLSYYVFVDTMWSNWSVYIGSDTTKMSISC
jgi:hypothetical protein